MCWPGLLICFRCLLCYYYRLVWWRQRYHRKEAQSWKCLSGVRLHPTLKHCTGPQTCYMSELRIKGEGNNHHSFININLKAICRKYGCQRMWSIQVFKAINLGFPGGSVGKESDCNAADLDSILGLRRSPRERNGNPLQYSCLENTMGRQAWWATVHRVTKSWTWPSA